MKADKLTQAAELLVNSLADRLRDIILELGISDAEFARTCSISTSLLSQILLYKTNPTIQVLYKMLLAYPEINEQYLVFGAGNMFKKVSLKTLPKKTTR